MGSNAKLCVPEACSVGVGSKPASGILIILSSDHSYDIYRPMKPQAVPTAIDSKDLLCSKWSMYIARHCQKPYGSLAFTIPRNAPGLVLRGHDKAHLTAVVKGKSTVGAELLCGLWLMSLEQETNTSASPFGGPGWLESDKDLLL